MHGLGYLRYGVHVGDIGAGVSGTVAGVPADARWTEFSRGIHFPAMEAPTALAADLHAVLCSLN